MRKLMQRYSENGSDQVEFSGMPWEADSTGRLDAFLAKNGAFPSRAKALDAVHQGLVLVNGRIARKGATVLKPGDRVELTESAEPVTETQIAARDIPLEVLYEDASCMVVNKPAGISVHPAPGVPKDAPTILHGAKLLFGRRRIPFHACSVLVHRLDRETTGCLLLAKTPAAHVVLQRQFKDRAVGKQYLAVVAGVPSPAAAVIDAPIGRHSGDRTKMAVFHSVSNRREAKTTYRTLAVAKEKDASLLQCDLHTGRTHQVRVHLQTIGHPLLGDDDYETASSRAAGRRVRRTDDPPLSLGTLRD
jgi:23S rRNA pseudouridine1911/1915/1917 synthase